MVDIHEILFRPGSDWRIHKDPLDDASIDEAKHRIGIELPAGLIDLYKMCNCGSGSLPFSPWSFVLWEIDNVAMLRMHEHYRRYYDEFVFFGSNSAGEYFGIDSRGRIFYMDAVAGEESIVIVAQSFDEFLMKIGFQSADRISGTGDQGVAEQLQYVAAANDAIKALGPQGARWWRYSVSHRTFLLVIGDPLARGGNVALELGACDAIRGPVSWEKQQLEVVLNDRRDLSMTWTFQLKDESVQFSATGKVFGWWRDRNILDRKELVKRD